MTSATANKTRRALTLGIKLRRNEDGATAVEFGLIALPFFMMLFGILGVCHYFFWTFTAENAVWNASRAMRTGAFQTGAVGTPYAPYYTGGVLTDAAGLKTEFRKQICEGTVNKGDCNANAIVLVKSTSGASAFGSFTPPACKTAANALVADADAMAAFDAGAQSSTVLVTLCYAWAFGGKLPFLKFGSLADGSVLIQASAAFRTEPY
jgi:hypothetical protein